LSAAPQTANDAADAFIQRIKYDPQYFLDEVLQLRRLPTDKTDEWVRDQWQSDLLEAIADVWRHKDGKPTKINHEGKNFITMRAMHGPGKTFGGAAVVHYFNSCWPGRIFATAPKLKQVKDLLFSELRKIRSRAVEWYRSLIDIQATQAQWCGDPDWCLLADSASNPENMAGKHAAHVLVFVDEASGVPETLWPVIMAALSTGHVVILLMISNPTQMQGTFAASHLDPNLAQDYHRVHVSVDKVTNPLRSVQMKSWREKMIRRYGRNSPVVAVRCFGEFAGSGPNQLFAQEWLEAARSNDRDSDGSQPMIRISVDVSDGGECETVVTAARRYDTFTKAMRMRRFSHPPALAPIMAADEAEKLFNELKGRKGIDDFVIDSIGVGAGTAGTLIQRGHKVIIHKGGDASADPKRWRNKRCQSHFNCRDALRDGLVSFDDNFFADDPDAFNAWTEFFAQMCSIKKREDNEKVDDLVPKAQMLADGIASPDMAESFVMQWSTMTASIVPGSASMKGGSNNVGVQVISSDLLEGLM
jgi:phage terminase large subunit